MRGTLPNASPSSAAEPKALTTSGFAGLLKPMWLALIWTKWSRPFAAFWLFRPNACDAGTPPATVQITQVPAQAMHARVAGVENPDERREIIDYLKRNSPK